MQYEAHKGDASPQRSLTAVNHETVHKEPGVEAAVESYKGKASQTQANI
jgi:hypothetical protein